MKNRRIRFFTWLGYAVIHAAIFGGATWLAALVNPEAGIITVAVCVMVGYLIGDRADRSMAKFTITTPK